MRGAYQTQQTSANFAELQWNDLSCISYSVSYFGVPRLLVTMEVPLAKRLIWDGG
jgi:hypothetical protein